MLNRQQSLDSNVHYYNGGYRTSPFSPAESFHSRDRALTEARTIRSRNLSEASLAMSDDVHSVPTRTSSPGIRKLWQRRPSTASGSESANGHLNTKNREEVTPWEFQVLSPVASSRGKAHIRDLQKLRQITSPSPSRSSQDSSNSSPPSLSQSPRRPKTSSGSLGSASFSQVPPPIRSMSTSATIAIQNRLNPSTITGPVSEVTPWELYPVPRRGSVSTSLRSESVGVASPSSSQVLIVAPTTNTGPVEEVIPWELAPGPKETPRFGSPPPSPTRGNSKIGSLFKSKQDLKVSKHTSPLKSIPTQSTNFAPLPNISLELLDSYMLAHPHSVPRIAINQSLAASKNSFTWSSEGSVTDLKQTGQTNSVFKWALSGNRSDRDLAASSSNASIGGRTRQWPLTGPVEDVTPWEVASLPGADVDQKIIVSWKNHTHKGNPLAKLTHLTTTSSSPMSPTIEIWNSQKVAWQAQGSPLTQEDGRSRSSSALPLSKMRAQTDTVAGTSLNRERAIASTTSLPLQSNRDGRVESATKFVEPPRDVPLTRTRGRSLTDQSVTASASVGHGERVGATSMISTLDVAQMEEVAPWELYPIPVQTAIKTPRTSSSSVAGKALAELGLKKRKSAGKANGTTGVTRIPSTSGSSFTVTKEALPVPSIPTMGAGMSSKGISNVSLFPVSAVHSSSSNSSAQTRTTISSTGKEKGPVSSAQTFEPTSDVNLAKFSTADRTILEELKANIRAREAQFMLKGVGNTMLGGRRCSGKRYHPFSKKEVPYPRSYDRDVVDLDVWETMFWLDLSKGLSWHTFENPPTKVLDIGCGTGTWILQASTTWKDCHFVGLDIVPLHPNLQNFGSLDSAPRITWIQHNFLDGLPFQNEEFDFVHIKRIALGIPEDKWDGFLEEVHRVMKTGGALEMIEEDLFFPGKAVDDSEDPVPNLDTKSLHGNGTTASRSMPQINEKEVFNSASARGSTFGMPGGISPHNPRDHTVLSAIWHGMLESRFVNMAPLSLLPTYLEYHFQDVRTHPPIQYSFPPRDKPSCSPQSTPASPLMKAPSLKSIESNRTADNTSSRFLTKNHNKPRSLYVALDETRSDALSPSDLVPSPKKTKSHLANLPDRTVSVDIRTLNLHLALRAKEIVGCSEPMWEWVLECQAKQSKKPRFRSDSIEVALLGSSRVFNGRDSDAFVKDAILEMTREDFDQILTNFQLDMQDKASIKAALEQRFDWHTFSSEPLQDRKAFDTSCRVYDDWVDQEIRNENADMMSSNTTPIDTTSSPISTFSSGTMSSTFSSTTYAPLTSCQQLSRAMRVFVAWKSRSII